MLGKCFAKPKPQDLKEKARDEYIFYRINRYGIATVEEAKAMNNEELSLANAIAEEFEDQQDIRFHNEMLKAIGEAFGGTED